MLFEPLEPNERFRARREAARRRQRRRRSIAVALLLATLLGMAAGATVISGDERPVRAAAKPPARPAPKPKPKPAAPKPRALPDEVRGVHVTMALASLDGKLAEYLDLTREGLNAIELDIKDENGEVGFVASAVPLAKQIGAARPYYKPRQVAKSTHARGVYLIGRVVVFEDPLLAAGRPELAIQTSGGAVWHNDAGLGWSNPYDRRVWDYNVSIAEVAARAGFDEIQFDYVRFPTDGDTTSIVYPGKTATPPAWVIAEFVHYAARRLKPLGVRVSTDVFGLAATRDLGIGQLPKRISKYVDAVYPMVYPSHYGPGEYGLDDPNAAPGETVQYSLSHFRRELRSSKAELIPWLQDFSYGRTYGLADVQAQIAATRQLGARGYLLWNAAGVYTPGALAPATG
ncbi:MAG: putative glycoside hydrolase [Gaiellaceae bacterium MAG52_C11]|nr:putative glycoside hydrolase [Candidatus Gaiellasilicea maunaloa]